MKTVWCYDDNGWYTDVDTVEESPLEPGEYLFPAQCTDQQIPFCPDNHWPFWNGEKWEARVHPKLAELERRGRDLELIRTDWCVLIDSPLSPEERAEIIQYRQALRDVPAQAGFPLNINWPTRPKFLK